jgi:hypothetical protein
VSVLQLPVTGVLLHTGIALLSSSVSSCLGLVRMYIERVCVDSRLWLYGCMTSGRVGGSGCSHAEVGAAALCAGSAWLHRQLLCCHMCG